MPKEARKTLKISNNWLSEKMRANRDMECLRDHHTGPSRLIQAHTGSYRNHTGSYRRLQAPEDRLFLRLSCLFPFAPYSSTKGRSYRNKIEVSHLTLCLNLPWHYIINVTRIHKTGVRWFPACKDGNGCPRRKYAQDGAKSVSRQELSRKTTCMSLYSPV